VLVLTRKKGQSVIIGDNIEVTVLSVSGDKVRLGIRADKEIPIYRNEVYERVDGRGPTQAPETPAGS
jgi:carbon storage regulator